MRTRALLVAIVAAAVSVTGAAPATAAPATLVDDTLADFAAAPGGTGTWVTEPFDAVRLRPTALSEGFEGPGPNLPASLTSVAWNQPDGSAVVGAGVLTLDGVRVHPDTTTLAAPQELEFRATFANALNQHVGFGNDFETGPWAMFSMGNASPPRLHVRTRIADAAPSQDEEIAGINPLLPHVYRVVWSPTEVSYFVDGNLVATHTATFATPMRPVASDFAADGSAIAIDWLGLGSHPASGVFESRVHDAGEKLEAWTGLTASASGGGTIDFETRTGNTTATGDGTWSPWEPIGAGGAIASPLRRYIQYRATLSQGSPILDSVTIAYEVDTAGPVAVIDGVDVSGASASVRFSSGDADVDRFECRLGSGGGFAPCTSPQAFHGLSSGSYTVFVRAVDDAGNVSAVVEREFVIPDPPPQGGGGGGGDPAPPPANPGPVIVQDTKAPAVAIPTRSARASRSGIVEVRARCPADEASCRVSVRLKHGRTTSQAKTATILGGKQAALRVRLPKAVRTLLTERRRLRVSVLVSARDAAGNLHTSTKRLILTPRT